MKKLRNFRSYSSLKKTQLHLLSQDVSVDQHDLFEVPLAECGPVLLVPQRLVLGAHTQADLLQPVRSGRDGRQRDGQGLGHRALPHQGLIGETQSVEFWDGLQDESESKKRKRIDFISR